MSCVLCPVTLNGSYILNLFEKLELLMTHFPHLIRIAFQTLVCGVRLIMCVMDQL